VEGAVAFRYPEPCTGPPDRCRCPWERLGDCRSGCVADGVEIVVSREHALAQLCAPAPGEIVAFPVRDAASVAQCEGTFLCEGATVVACGPPPAAVAACVRGEVLDDPLTAPAATALLCAR
jgi:hypothetical protein